MRGSGSASAQGSRPVRTDAIEADGGRSLADSVIAALATRESLLVLTMPSSCWTAPENSRHALQRSGEVFGAQADRLAALASSFPTSATPKPLTDDQIITLAVDALDAASLSAGRASS